MPFGEVRTEIGTISQTDFSFTGQRSISMLSIMDYITRNYDPAIGRFIQPDTIIPSAANPQSWNRYSYVMNNPIMYSDPTGHSWEDCKKRMNGYQCKIHQRQVHRLMAEWERNAILKIFKNSYGDNSNHDQPTIPADPSQPPPIEQRIVTVVFMAPFFLILDVTLFVITSANTVALMGDLEPITKAILLTTEVLIVGSDIVVAFAQISYAHWVVTGEFISKNNMDDWSSRP